MRVSLTTLVFSGTVAAYSLAPRQNNGHGTENGLDKGACKKVTLIFGRGSTESGNMGGYVGPYLADALTKEYGKDIAVQGVNYDAAWSTNYIGGDPKGWAEFTRLFTLASTKCPDTIVVASGYSQGAGLLHNTIPKLDAKVKAQIAGIVNFGDTYQVKDKALIPTYPKEKYLAFCSTTDLVCHDPTANNPIIMPAHIMYSSDTPEAAKFLKKMISAAQVSAASSASTGSATGSSPSKSSPSSASSSGTSSSGTSSSGTSSSGNSSSGTSSSGAAAAKGTPKATPKGGSSRGFGWLFGLNNSRG